MVDFREHFRCKFEATEPLPSHNGSCYSTNVHYGVARMIIDQEQTMGESVAGIVES